MKIDDNEKFRLEIEFRELCRKFLKAHSTFFKAQSELFKIKHEICENKYKSDKHIKDLELLNIFS